MATSHPLVVGLFESGSPASAAAHALRQRGLARERVSIVASSHAIEGALAAASGASPGTEIEDSRVAARAGELGGYALAAIAMVLPGIGPIVAGGPLAADLGEAAGHLAGGVAKALENAGFEVARAEHWEQRIFEGAVLVGAHVPEEGVAGAAEVLARFGVVDQATVTWPGDLG